MYDPQKVINIALAEVGYKEKASNAQLDDKTANAGNGNYTKYARDMDAIPGYYNGRKQTVEWCDIFADWCFVQAYGPEAGRKLLLQPLGSSGAGCRWSRNYFKSKGRLFDSPQPGDQIFFWPADRTDPNIVQHTGLVYAVDKAYVYTVEGNVSNAVLKKKYALDNVRIAGYGRPDWDADYGGDVTMPTQPIGNTRDTIRKGAKGPTVIEMQGLLLAHGMQLPKSGADGDFGVETETAVKAFQASHGLKVDGICGPQTWAALLAEPESTTPPSDPVDTYVFTVPAITAAQAMAECDRLRAAYGGCEVAVG